MPTAHVARTEPQHERDLRDAFVHRLQHYVPRVGDEADQDPRQPDVEQAEAPEQYILRAKLLSPRAMIVTPSPRVSRTNLASIRMPTIRAYLRCTGVVVMPSARPLACPTHSIIWIRDWKNCVAPLVANRSSTP
jgi:hypothetical protein